MEEDKEPQIRVGKCIRKGFGYSTPSYKNHVSIRIHAMEKEFGELSPYRIADARGRSIENLWQFSKVYPAVNQSTQKKSYTTQVIWQWPAQVHYMGPHKDLNINNLQINKLSYEFWQWRRSGFNCDYAIRYPVGYKSRHKVICSCWPTDGMVAEDEFLSIDKNLMAKSYVRPIEQKVPIYDCSTGNLLYMGDEYKKDEIEPYIPKNRTTTNYDLLGYVDARKRIYCGLYAELVKNHPKFLQLKRELAKGTKLVISEVDGPRFSEQWPYNLVSQDSIPFTYDICKHLINDVNYPFGHGYTIAALLMGWDDLIRDSKYVTLGGDLMNYTMKN